jgi:predicted lactoylglutathione lyase
MVRRAVHNEVSSNQSSGMHFRFKDENRTPQLSQTKLMVETSDATAGLLVMQNGHPLTLQQRHDEEARLANYVQSPQALRKKKKQEKEDTEHTERILRALPDAFLYERAGTEPGREGLGAPGDELVRLNFRPNPDYTPPSHVEQVLTGMSGNLLIDTAQNRIAEINGTLSKEVEFGWGILGHLDPGGKFLVQQADVGQHQWEVIHMELSFTGKVLFFKKIGIHSNDTFSDFHSVPGNLTFAQGVELLKKEAAENPSGSKGSDAERKLMESAQNRNRVEAKDEAVCCHP